MSVFTPVKNWLKNTAIFKWLEQFPTFTFILGAVTKFGIWPFLVGIIILALGSRYMFLNAVVSSLWRTVGWGASYLLVDGVLFPGYETLAEIKKGNMAVAITTAAILLGLAYLWQQ